MEHLLRACHQRAALWLCDYVDLISGTSTGAIIASGLAIGMTASEIKRMYLELGGKSSAQTDGGESYRSSSTRHNCGWRSKQSLATTRWAIPQSTTGLCIIAKRADTGSTWPLLNHLEGRYYPYNITCVWMKTD
jgi:uncharacterized protein